MKTNELPHYDDSVNTTGCCPKFNPDGWDARNLHFESKPFMRATTRSRDHVPLDMAEVFERVQRHMIDAGAYDSDNCIVLSRDLSASQSEHLFSISKPVSEEEAITLSGDYVTKVFEGSYEKTQDWYTEMEELVRARGGEPTDVYFFYTTCPKCADAYGQNYIIGVARI